MLSTLTYFQANVLPAYLNVIDSQPSVCKCSHYRMKAYWVIFLFQVSFWGGGCHHVVTRLPTAGFMEHVEWTAKLNQFDSICRSRVRMACIEETPNFSGSQSVLTIQQQDHNKSLKIGDAVKWPQLYPMGQFWQLEFSLGYGEMCLLAPG